MGYFFFDFNDKKKQDARALLISLLVQLSNQSDSFCDILYGLHDTHQRGSRQPKESVLISCLEKMLRIPWKVPIYLIIDALDECPNDTGVLSPRDEVLKLVKRLINMNVANLRLCVTSRFEVDIKTYLEPLTSTSTSTRISLQDQDGQKRDIEQYIKSVIDSDAFKILRWTDGDKTLVFNELSKKADGM
jgi:hypothetical protein